MMRSLLVATLCLALYGCATPRADLDRLCRIEPGVQPQRPVVVLHGAFGSKLRRVSDSKELWPRGLLDLLFGNYEDVGLTIDPETFAATADDSEAYALIDRIGERDLYGALIDTLASAGHYTPFDHATSPAEVKHSYQVLVYDWRLDVAEGARRLDALIERIRAAAGEPGLKVDIIAHSAGALIARYYLRYGGNDVLGQPDVESGRGNADKVHTAVLIGSPNLGALSALQTVVEGYRVGLGTIPPEVLATMPVAYQLLPFPDEPWGVRTDGSIEPRNLYSMDTWRHFGWGPFDPRVQEGIDSRFDDPAEAARYLTLLENFAARQLNRAERLHRALSIPAPPSTVRYVVLGGQCLPTPALALVEPTGDGDIAHFTPPIGSPQTSVSAASLMLTPGDGRVTRRSALGRTASDPGAAPAVPGPFPLSYAVFLCESHDQLTSNISFRVNLLDILLGEVAQGQCPAP